MNTNKHYGKDFLNQFVEDTPSTNPILKKQGHKAFQILQKNGFPNTKMESWKYTNLDKILQQKLTFSKNTNETISFKSLAKTHSELVFINGFFQETMSNYQENGFRFCSNFIPKNTTPLSLDKIVEKEPFVNFNLAYNQQVNFLELMENAIIKRPIHIVHIHTTEDTISLPYMIIKQNANSEATICETYHCQTSGLISAINNLYLDENAKLKYYRFSSNDNNYYFNKTYVELQKDANIQVNSYNLGGKISRINLEIEFNGTGAYATADGLYTVKGQEKCDNRIEFHHHQPHTTSKQLYKGVLSGKSRGIFNSKVFIDQDAQKVDSEQISNNLLLDKMARVDAKPELDVKADDVKAMHGATVGQLNLEELFYLQSRGIDKQTAFKMLIYSFVDQIILKTNQKEFREVIHDACYYQFLKKLVF